MSRFRAQSTLAVTCRDDLSDFQDRRIQPLCHPPSSRKFVVDKVLLLSRDSHDAAPRDNPHTYFGAIRVYDAARRERTLAITLAFVENILQPDLVLHSVP
jgi:hypothetical protein